MQGSPVLHTARAGHGQQASYRDLALGTPASETDFAPLHGAPQSTLGRIVGWLDAFISQEGEEPLKVQQKGAGEIGDIFVATFGIAVRQCEKLLLQRNGFSD